MYQCDYGSRVMYITMSLQPVSKFIMRLDTEESAIPEPQLLSGEQALPCGCTYVVVLLLAVFDLWLSVLRPENLFFSYEGFPQAFMLDCSFKGARTAGRPSPLFDNQYGWLQHSADSRLIALCYQQAHELPLLTFTAKCILKVKLASELQQWAGMLQLNLHSQAH